jgi:hypothetical protein
VTNIVGAVGIVFLLVALAVVTRRERPSGLGRERSDGVCASVLGVSSLGRITTGATPRYDVSIELPSVILTLCGASHD